MARPKKIIDYNLVSKLANIMCTQEEIASIIDCNVRTLQRDKEFCRVFKKGKESGKMSLRRTQWKLAEKNASMAIWLGKQYLGQTDKVETTTEAKITPKIELEIIDNSELESVLYDNKE